MSAPTTPLPCPGVTEIGDYAPSDLAAEAPVTESDAAFALDATHFRRVVRCTNAGLVTVDIPTDAEDPLLAGYEVVLFAEGAGGVTLDDTGLTILGSSPNLSIAQNEGIYLIKAAADTWIVLGGTAA